MRRINKKAVAVLVIVLLVIVVGVIILINLINDKPTNQKQQLEDLFKTMSTEYYEQFYYNQIGSTQEEKETVLKKFEKTGIKISLDSLSRYNSEVNKDRIEQFVNLETNEKCDTKNTISILYPIEPYEKNSYNIEIKLACGFTE